MIRRSSLIALEVVLALAAAALIALGVAWWRLSQGPVELNFIREHVQSELSEARSGRPVGWHSNPRIASLPVRGADAFEPDRLSDGALVGFCRGPTPARSFRMAFACRGQL